MWSASMDNNAAPSAGCTITDDSDSSEQKEQQESGMSISRFWPSLISSSSSPMAQAQDMSAATAEEVPSSLPTSKMAGDFLIKTMKSLSIQEREQVDDDVHGISVPTPVTAAAATTQSMPGNHSPRHPQDYDETRISSMSPTTDAVPSSSSAAFSNGTTTVRDHATTDNQIGGTHETPEFVNHCLDCFDRELETILQSQGTSNGANSNSGAIAMALHQNRAHVQSLRLKFIRVEKYDIKNAVRRLISTFSKKLELFGESLLTKDITISDLSVADTSFLQTGTLSLFPRRDRAGRTFIALMVGLDHKLNNKVVTVKNKVRVLWYLANVASQDVETQLKGVVGLVYSNVSNIGAGDKTPAQHYVEESETHFHLAKMLTCIPVRYTALHYCYNSRKLEPLVNLGIMAVDSTISVRFRQHCGSDSEIAYKLMTFGIPKDILPFANSGTKLKMNYHKEFMNYQIRREQRQQQRIAIAGGPNHVPTDLPGVIVPGTYDVLLGRQTYARTHIGNVRLHHLVEEHSGQYDNATNKFEKTIIVSMIVDMIKSGRGNSSANGNDLGASQQQQLDKQGGVFGGRFLQLGEDGWVAVGDDVCRDRVSHAFRNHRARGAPKTSNRSGGERRRRRSLKDDVDSGNPGSNPSNVGPPSSVLSVSHPHDPQNQEGTRCWSGICGSSNNDSGSESSKRSRITFG